MTKYINWDIIWIYCEKVVGTPQHIVKGGYTVLVKKRDGRKVQYDENKIINAINKANAEVTESERVTHEKILEIVSEVETTLKNNLTVEGIQDFIEQKLMEDNKHPC